MSRLATPAPQTPHPWTRAATPRGIKSPFSGLIIETFEKQGFLAFRDRERRKTGRFEHSGYRLAFVS